MGAGAFSQEEEAYIFQRSPYHGLRVSAYSARPASEPLPDARARAAAASERGSAAELEDETLAVVDAERRNGTGSEKLRRSKAVVSSTKPRGPSTLESQDKVEPELPSEEKTVAELSHEQILERFYAMAGDPLEPEGGRIVVHRGNPSARLMIIGEAPGRNEDLEGKPFVGKAGQLLDKIFQYGGFDMERQVYVTNVAKRRPSNNRTPKLEEIQYYLPSLMDEIAVIDPKIIVLAGSVAAKALLGASTKITAVRGQWLKISEGGPDVMPVFHPSYLLRNPEAKRDMVVDIEEIRARFLQLVPDEELQPLRKR